jgi:hypothetical protein
MAQDLGSSNMALSRHLHLLGCFKSREFIEQLKALDPGLSSLLSHSVSRIVFQLIN